MIAFERRSGYAPSASSEMASMARPRLNRSGYSGVLVCHMYGASSSIAHDPLYGAPGWEIAKNDSFAFTADLGGANQWGNDAALARMDDAYAYLLAEGMVGTKVGLASYSMGTHQALGWASRNPEKVSGIALMLPTPGLQMTHDDFPSLAPGIDLAYTNHAGYLAALSTHDYVNLLETLRTIPVCIYEDINDPFSIGTGSTPPRYSYILDQLPNADMVTFSGGGHTLDGLDPALPADFLLECATA